MDYIAKGTLDRSILFHLSTGGLTVSTFKISYTRYSLGDGSSFTTSGAVALTALASITTAHTDNRGIYITTTADDGGKFLFRTDFPDAAFATGKEMVICSIFNSADIVVGQRIFQLEVDPSIMQKYSGSHGLGIYINTTIVNTNSQLGIDGTVNKPVSTLAAAKTLADAIGIKKFYFVQGASGDAGVIDLLVTYNFYTFIGLTNPEMHQISLNNQDVNHSRFINMSVCGLQGGLEMMYMDGGKIHQKASDTTQFHHLIADNVRLTETILQADSQTVIYNNCYGTPNFNFDSIVCQLNINDFKGGTVSISTAGPTSLLTITGKGYLIFNDCDVNFGAIVAGSFYIEKSGGTLAAISDQANFERQNVRESMVLAVDGTHTIAANSIDDKLDTIDNFIDTEVSAIKAKTDQLTFSVSNQVDSNVKSMDTDVITSSTIATSAIIEIQAGLSTLTQAQVNAEVVDVLTVDTIPELTTITPASTTIANMIQLNHMAIRNKNTTSTSENKLYNDAGAVIATAPINDNGTTFTKDEFV